MLLMKFLNLKHCKSLVFRIRLLSCCNSEEACVCYCVSLLWEALAASCSKYGGEYPQVPLGLR